MNKKLYNVILIFSGIFLLFSCNNQKDEYNETDSEYFKPLSEKTSYERGLKFYDEKLYSWAKEEFEKVEKSDSNYADAQVKIKICNEKYDLIDKEYTQYSNKDKENDLLSDRNFKNSKAGKIYSFCQRKSIIVSKRDCIDAADGKIWIGMNIWLLVAKRGNPNSVNTSNYGYGDQKQYCWNNWDPGCFYDKDGDNLVDAYN